MWAAAHRFGFVFFSSGTRCVCAAFKTWPLPIIRYGTEAATLHSQRQAPKLGPTQTQLTLGVLLVLRHRSGQAGRGARRCVWGWACPSGKSKRVGKQYSSIDVVDRCKKQPIKRMIPRDQNPAVRECARSKTVTEAKSKKTEKRSPSSIYRILPFQHVLLRKRRYGPPLPPSEAIPTCTCSFAT